MADDAPAAASPRPPLGERARDAWVGTVDAAHDAIADRIKGKKHEFLTEFLEGVEQELAPHFAPILQAHLDDPDFPEPLRSMFAEAVAPTHQTGALIGGIAVGAAVSPAIASAFAPFITSLANAAWSSHPVRPLSPAEVALAMVKNNPHLGDPYTEARQTGINKDRLDALEYNTGRPLALQELLLLYRRGQIDQARLLKGVQQSDVRDEWFDALLDLRFAPLSVGETITAALKHHLDPTTARTYLGYAGINPEHFDVLLASAGRPLGLEQTLHLWNRGIVGEPFVRQAIAQSDINPDYTEAALELRHYFPPPRSLVPMLRSEAITEAQFRKWMSYYGADPEVVQAFILEATHSSSATVKQVTQAQVVGAYVDRLLTRAEASDRLVKLKFSPADAALLLDFADDKRHAQLVASAARAIGSKYVGYRITRTEAQDSLTRADVPVDAAHDMLTLWDIERDANERDVTPSQVVGALRRGLISPAQTLARLTQLGVPTRDIGIVVADGWPPTAGGEARAAAAAVLAGAASLPSSGGSGGATGKAPTTTQILNEYTAGVLTKAQAHAALVNLGYSSTDATNLLALQDSTHPPGA